MKGYLDPFHEDKKPASGAHLLFYEGINRTMLFFNLVPLFAILFSYLILGDPVTLVNIVSAGIIITVVVLNSRTESVGSN